MLVVKYGTSGEVWAGGDRGTFGVALKSISKRVYKLD